MIKHAGRRCACASATGHARLLCEVLFTLADVVRLALAEAGGPRGALGIVWCQGQELMT